VQGVINQGGTERNIRQTKRDKAGQFWEKLKKPGRAGMQGFCKKKEGSFRDVLHLAGEKEAAFTSWSGEGPGGSLQTEKKIVRTRTTVVHERTFLFRVYTF